VAKVIKTQLYEEVATSRLIENCLIEGDIIDEVLSNVEKDMNFSIYSTSEPIVFDLPTSFMYETDYGIRRVVARQQISFIGNAMKLNIDKQGIFYKDKFIPVFPLKTLNYAG
jgi:CRISPR-associated protein Cas5t